MSIESVFLNFCAFGAGLDQVALMDNSKFAKLFRDLKLLDKKFTSTDVDIIFNRTEVKPKHERKINFDQFMEALKYIAIKKYPGDSGGYDKVIGAIIAGKGPSGSGTKSTSESVVDRLTDTSKYTGAHKQRFDESGKGRGLKGTRDSDTRGKWRDTVPGPVASQAAYVFGYKHEGTYGKK